MSDENERRSQLAEGTRRGVGWGIGFALVLGTASALRQGTQPTVKAAMKGVLRVRETAAELAERVQDLYAEAQSEYAAESHARGDDE